MLGATRPTGGGAGGPINASQVIGLGGGAGPLVFTPGPVNNIAANSIISSAAGTVRVASVASITLTSNPQIATGLDGQKITVVNIGALPVTFVNGSGLLMPQNYVLYGGKNVSFTYSTSFSSWILDGIIPESAILTGAPTVPLPAWNTDSQQIAPTGFVYDHLYDHNFPGWRALTLTANWVNFGGPFSSPAIKRVGRDLIYVRGVVQVSGSYSATIVAAGASGLPADCRPSNTLNLPGFTSAGAGQVSVNADGSVVAGTALAVGQFQVIQFSYSL